MKWRDAAKPYSVVTADNERNNTKETACCDWLLVVIEHFNIDVPDFDANKSACSTCM